MSEPVITAHRLREYIKNYYPGVQSLDSPTAAAFHSPFEFLVHEMWKRDRVEDCPHAPAPDTAGGGEEPDKPFIDRDHCRQAHGCLGGCRSVREHAAYALRHWTVRTMNEDHAKRQACPSCAAEKPEPPCLDPMASGGICPCQEPEPPKLSLPLGHAFFRVYMEDVCGFYTNPPSEFQCGQPRSAHEPSR